MGTNSQIQWTDHSWNVAVGCTKVDADCKFCYMYRESMNGTRFDPKIIRRTKSVFNMPLKIKEPSKIFTCSYTDFFHEAIDEYRDECWEIIRKCPQHTFQILTKRPERIKDHLPSDWGSGYENVWLGTSVGSMDGIERLSSLMFVQSKVKFLSAEPLYEGLDIRPYLQTSSGCPYYVGDDDEMFWGLDWVIIGGESGNENGKYKYRPCQIKWISEIVYDCEQTNTPVFVKQMGTHIAKQFGMSDRHGGNIDEFPEHLRIRQFPK